MNPSTHCWHQLNLGDALLAYDAQNDAVQSFQSAYEIAHESARQPDNMALFVRHESDGRLQCEVKLYFSPESEAIARHLGARPCSPPSLDDLSLLAGTYDHPQ